jgi:hypothetical protein
LLVVVLRLPLLVMEAPFLLRLLLMLEAWRHLLVE